MFDIKDDGVKVLLTNDDGIDSLALTRLSNELIKEFEVMIVAPSFNCSGASHSFTTDKAIKVKENYNFNCKAFEVEGQPVDCVKFAILNLKEFCPDIVVSGVNLAHNLGTDTLYSATLSQAIEGAYFDKISFAFSTYSKKEDYFDEFATIAVKIIKELLLFSKPGDVYNVNFPKSKVKIKGVKITRLCKVYYNDKYVKVGDNEYLLKGEPIGYNSFNNLDVKDCDYYWLQKGYVTITPISIDKTDNNLLFNLRNLCIKL